ncbi:hypothetical protein LMG19083_01026 [Ralstonia psammae]|uniref:Uncharacterized protein n=1 Tax=Ralstonia psammae TaxID=3058598 RepID=A0ABN9IHV2_9RALS|nr:hypothetical protein LMG19083_01026 [Ralstonia sp. LMG 19083]
MALPWQDIMWQPIEEAELWNRLQADIQGVSPTTRSLVPTLSRPLATLYCERTNGNTERLLVIVRVGERALVYDDVEEEYAIAHVPEGGLLRNWQLYGPLEAALLALFAKP